jgi:hypothetical protein
MIPLAVEKQEQKKIAEVVREITISAQMTERG